MMRFRIGKNALGQSAFVTEIRVVVRTGDEGDHDLQILHALADEVVPPVHVCVMRE